MFAEHALLRRQLPYDRHVLVVGEGEARLLQERLEAEALPVFQHAKLGGAVETVIALARGELGGVVGHLPADAETPELGPHRRPLRLGEIGEPADAEGTGGFPVDTGDEVGGGEVVAVELLVIGAGLLGAEDEAAEHEDLGQVVEAADHVDGDFGFGAGGRIVHRASSSHSAGAMDCGPRSAASAAVTLGVVIPCAPARMAVAEISPLRTTGKG